MEKVSVSFFVTNFPTEVDATSLRQICKNFSVVSDVYMAKKLSKLGK